MPQSAASVLRMRCGLTTDLIYKLTAEFSTYIGHSFAGFFTPRIAQRARKQILQPVVVPET